VNAYTLGIDRPWIVVTTGALDLFDDAELRFVLGHECGHVLSGHGVYRTMLHQLMALAARVAWIPVGGWGLRAVVFALEEWQRAAELSGDRAGLLVVQDVDAALRAHMKTAAARACVTWTPGRSSRSPTTTGTRRRPATASPSCST
jgi:Zn-dependent protease with chaperone function